jgi:hypothetical protein
MIHVVQHIQIHRACETENAQRNIHGNFVMKPYQMKMIIRSIDDDELLKEKDAKSNAKVYGSIIDRLFYIVHIFRNITMLISTSKSVQVLARSNTFSNTYIRATIG